MKRNWTVIFLCLMVFAQAGCAPPPKSGPGAKYGASIPSEGGRAIISVAEKTKPPFRTVEQNGAELIEARGEVGRFGGTFSVSQIGDGPKTFNPWVSTDATSGTLGGMMFSGLVTTDAYTGNVLPYLAKEVKLGDDKMTYTVTLRKGLKWSDGQPLTAKDVLFTWNEIIKPGFGNASLRDGVLVEGKFPEVKQLDDMTIQFKTAKPFVPFLRTGLGIAIAPEHVLKPVVAKGNDAFSAFWGVTTAEKHPEQFVGCGMWLLKGYDPRLEARFKRNPDFFMVDKKGQRLPYLNEYRMSFVGDMNNMELQFEQGKTDTYGVPPNFVSRLRTLTKPAYKLYNLGPASGTMFMAFNETTRKNDQGKPLVDPIKSVWFNDVNFRQAVNHTINREDIVNNILKGVGAPLFTAESLSSIFLNKTLAKGFPPDVDYAKSLLKKSGFTWDANGQLMDAKGHRVEFTMLTNSGNNEREAVGVNIKQDLTALGMKVNFKPIDFNVLSDSFKEGNWESMIMGLTGDNLEPHSGVNVWKSDGFLHFFNRRKLVSGKPTDISDRKPWEKEIDALMEQGAQTFDLAERHKIYDKVQQIIFDEAPMVYLYSPLSIMAVRDRIRNFDPTPLEAFHNLEEIWVDPGAEK